MEFILFQPLCHYVQDNHWTDSDIPLTCHEFLRIFKFWGNSYFNMLFKEERRNKETDTRTSNALANPIFPANFDSKIIILNIVSEYDQEIPQSQTADNLKIIIPNFGVFLTFLMGE